MRDYRVYYLNAAGRVLRREVISCEGDDKALALLPPPADEAAVELWDLGRLVRRVERHPGVKT